MRTTRVLSVRLVLAMLALPLSARQIRYVNGTRGIRLEVSVDVPSGHAFGFSMSDVTVVRTRHPRFTHTTFPVSASVK